MLLAFLCVAAPVAAQTSIVIDPTLFSFPGGFDHPPSAASASLALSDRWLGDEPFANPATPLAQRVNASLALLHSSRQDLRAGNRNYDEQPVTFDGAGVALGVPGLPVWLYAHQPILRIEDFVFNRGNGTDPSVPPATIKGQVEAREARAGLASSLALAGVRYGAALEWTWRDDRYWTQETSGSPDQGQRTIAFTGNAIGWAVGARWETPDTSAGKWTVGGAVRSLPKLKVDGDVTLDLLSGYSNTPLSAEREAGWEGGVSIRYGLAGSFAMSAGFGGRSEQRWEGLGITSGAVTAWSLGGEFHDRGDPWALRFGFGQEQQPGVPETQASSLGLGFGWDMEGVILDLGLLHRSVERSGRPHSYDDRVIASVRVDF